MENSLKTSIQLNLNLKLHNSESTIFGLRRLGLPTREFQCERYYFNNWHSTYFQKNTDKYTIHFIPVRRKVFDELQLSTYFWDNPRTFHFDRTQFYCKIPIL